MISRRAHCCRFTHAKSQRWPLVGRVSKFETHATRPPSRATRRPRWISDGGGADVRPTAYRQRTYVERAAARCSRKLPMCSCFLEASQQPFSILNRPQCPRGSHTPSTHAEHARAASCVRPVCPWRCKVLSGVSVSVLQCPQRSASMYTRKCATQQQEGRQKRRRDNWIRTEKEG